MLTPELIAELTAARVELTAALKQKKRREAGMRRGDEDLIRNVDGSYNEREIERGTYYECFHCGSAWRDNPETRRRLDESSYYVASNLNASAENVGFSWPSWAGQRLAWGGRENMLGYLRAKRAHEEFGNVELLKQWYQKSAARAWDPNLIKKLRATIQEEYDVKSDWPEEWQGHRLMLVDCQQDLQYFWVTSHAVSKTGKTRQLWRGILKGFGDPKVKWEDQKETITGKQQEFGVKDHHVFLDARYMGKELREECAKHGHWKTIEGERVWMCWTTLMGSGLKDFSHSADQNSKVRHPVSDPYYEWVETKVEGKYKVSVENFYFSALRMGDMFVRYRDGNGPETIFLPEKESVEVKTSWTAQIHAPTKQYAVNKRTGETTEVWKPVNQTTPHHYFDLGRMLMTVLCLWEVAGD